VGEAVKKEEEETLTPVGPGAEGLKDADSTASEKDEPEDRRLAHEEGDEPDEPQAGARKKETAKERRERAKKSRERERLEYNFLLKRNEDLEKRFAALEGRTAQSENAAVDQRISTIQTQLGNADRVLAEALRKPNGAGAEEFVEAQRIRDELRDQLHELKQTAQQRQQAQKSQPARPEPAQPQPDPRVLRRARDWASQHDWFAFDGQDEDSVIVRAIDESLAAEGFDPTSSDYWDELTERVRHRLPERFKGARARANEDEDDDSDEEKPRPKSGPKFSSGGRERPLKKGEVYVSAERKAAMQQYGVWDDPVARNRMLKKYAQWDAEVSASNRS
jgi:hypothetical protein